jgi:predicted Zn-dependent peptidase
MMKNVFSLSCLVCLFTVKTASAQKPLQKPIVPAAPITSVASQNPKLEKGYQSFTNDPLHTRIYTLANGFKLYLSVNKAEPRIATYIAVKAGSKNDPADATGLAHYLEHMLFKGTDKFGTTDYEKEKPLLDKIESLYESYRIEKDSAKRKSIYHLIDSVSGLAAKVSIANEYDKLMMSIGAKETNAFTSLEETVYQNDIPSNQLENFLNIEYERFRNPIMRIFHTELEAVYEEKNRSLDNDDYKIWEALMSGLFEHHTYGTQTTIGTINHLKNPSLKNIKEYLKKYYVPNNMALCMSGDFDPDQVLKIAENTFGKLPSTVPPAPYIFEKENSTNKPKITEVYGPNPTSVTIGFRFNGGNTVDADIIKVLERMLTNKVSGMLENDLVKTGKLQSAYAETVVLNDYSALIIGAENNKGQSLEEVKDILFAEIEKLKLGDYPDWIMKAIVNNFKLSREKEFESNENIATILYKSFVSNTSYEHEIHFIDRIANISKKQLIIFMRNNFKDNYTIVYKREGEDKRHQKVTKPIITPVELNANAESEFVRKIKQSKLVETEPVFVDYEQQIQKSFINSNVPFWKVKNERNSLFQIDLVFDLGYADDKRMRLAADLFKTIGTSNLKPELLNQEFFKLGCEYDFKVNEHNSVITLQGLGENLQAGFKLFQSMLSDATLYDNTFDVYIKSRLKQMHDDQQSKSIILNQAMVKFAMYGNQSPFKNVYNPEELTNISDKEMIDFIKSLCSFEHMMWYYGTQPDGELISFLNSTHQTQKTLRHFNQNKSATEIPTTENKVYALEYDMRQAEVVMLSKQDLFNEAQLPIVRLFQEYFHDKVFQSLRESKALAYAVSGTYRTPNYKDKSFYSYAYIGTQADKLSEAMQGMHQLFDTLPAVNKDFETAKQSILQQIRSERIKPTAYCSNYYNALQMGYSKDIRKVIYDKIPSLQLTDLVSFHAQHFSQKPFTTLVIGKKELLPNTLLEKYGKVQWLKLEDVFGY